MRFDVFEYSECGDSPRDIFFAVNEFNRNRGQIVGRSVLGLQVFQPQSLRRTLAKSLPVGVFFRRPAVFHGVNTIAGIR